MELDTEAARARLIRSLNYYNRCIKDDEDILKNYTDARVQGELDIWNALHNTNHSIIYNDDNTVKLVRFYDADTGKKIETMGIVL